MEPPSTIPPEPSPGAALPLPLPPSLPPATTSAGSAAPSPAAAAAPLATPPLPIAVELSPFQLPALPPLPQPEPRPALPTCTSSSHSNSPSPGLVEKAVFGNPIRQALPSIHSFASAPGQGPPSGLYDRPRMEPNPIAQPRMAYSSGVNFPSLASLTAAREAVTAANALGSSSVPPPPASRPQLPSINQLSPPMGSAQLLSNPVLASAYRSNPMSVSSMLSGPPRDLAMSVYASQQNAAAAVSTATSTAGTTTPPRPPTLPPYDSTRRDDASLKHSTGPTVAPSAGSPALPAAGWRPDLASSADGGRSSAGNTNGSPRLAPPNVGGGASVASVKDKEAAPTAPAPPKPERSSYPPLPSAFARESPYSTWPLPAIVPAEENSATGSPAASSAPSSSNGTPSFPSRHLASSQNEAKPTVPPPAPKSNFFPSLNSYRQPPGPTHRTTTFPWTSVGQGPQHRGEYPDYYQQQRQDHQSHQGAGESGAAHKPASNNNNNNGHSHNASRSPQAQPLPNPGPSASSNAGPASVPRSNGAGAQQGRQQPEPYKPSAASAASKLFTGNRFVDVHPSSRVPQQQQQHQQQHQGQQQASQQAAQALAQQQQLQAQQQQLLAQQQARELQQKQEYAHAQAHAREHQLQQQREREREREREQQHVGQNGRDSPQGVQMPGGGGGGPVNLPGSPASNKRRRDEGGMMGESARSAKMVVRPPPPFSAAQARRAEIRSPLVRVESETVWKAIAVEAKRREEENGDGLWEGEQGAAKENEGVLESGGDKARYSLKDAVPEEGIPAKEERPYLGKVVYDPFVNPASLLDGNVLRNGIGGVVEIAVPTGLLDGCRYEVGPPEKYDGEAIGMDVDGDDGARQQLAVPGTVFDLEALRRRKVWGTDVYTDDSDILAIAIHSGWLRLAERPRDASAATPKGEATNSEAPKTLLVRLIVAPALVRYHGSTRQGLRSRSWGNGHDGVSLLVQNVALLPNRVQPHGRRWLKIRAGEVASRLAERDVPTPVSRSTSAASSTCDGVTGIGGEGRRRTFVLAAGAGNGSFVEGSDLGARE